MILLTATLISCCQSFSGKRKSAKAAQAQPIPAAIKNTSWKLSSFGRHAPDCDIVLMFRPEGKLEFQFKGVIYHGGYMWYRATEDSIFIHTSPMDKLVWTHDSCEINPYHFAMYIQGDKKLEILDGRMRCNWLNVELVFEKI